MANLRSRIEELWRRRAEIDPHDEDVMAVIREAIDLLDAGEARVAEVVDDEVVVHEWLKEAILLLFQQARMVTQELGPFEFADKIPLKSGFGEAGVRVMPGASARWGSFLVEEVEHYLRDRRDGDDRAAGRRAMVRRSRSSGAKAASRSS